MHIIHRWDKYVLWAHTKEGMRYVARRYRHCRACGDWQVKVEGYDGWYWVNLCSAPDVGSLSKQG